LPATRGNRRLGPVLVADFQVEADFSMKGLFRLLIRLHTCDVSNNLKGGDLMSSGNPAIRRRLSGTFGQWSNLYGSKVLPRT